jgi:hypothetical protein
MVVLMLMLGTVASVSWLALHRSEDDGPGARQKDDGPGARKKTTGQEDNRKPPGQGSDLASPGRGPGATPDGFVQLFNGRDKTGWKTHPDQRGNWQVLDGILTDTGSAGISHLYTERDDYKDFHLRVEARSGGLTGVYFRTAFGPAQPAKKPIWLVGYNAKLDKNRLGRLIIDDGKYGTVIGDHVPLIPAGQWLTLEVIVERNHIILKVDGKTTTDYTDDQMDRFPRGHIALQQHSTTRLRAEFRKIEIKELLQGESERQKR